MAGIDHNLSVLPAQSTDLVGIKKILRDENLPSDDLTEAHLKSYYILRDKKEIIAVVGAEIFQSSALLRSLVVKTGYRNNNIASRLVDEIESLLKSRHVRIIFLLTTTAGNFFAKRGYTITSRKTVPVEILNTEEFSALCPDSALCMLKHLE